MSCQAALSIKGETYKCDMECVDIEGNPVPSHEGWAHTNREAEAVWCGARDDDPMSWNLRT